MWVHTRDYVGTVKGMKIMATDFFLSYLLFFLTYFKCHTPSRTF